MERDKLKFDDLVRSITNEDTDQFQLNEAGEELLTQYYELVDSIQKAIQPIISPFVKNMPLLHKELTTQMFSTISSQDIATEDLDTMMRLDTLTNGGKTIIDGTVSAIHPDDAINKYITRL